jgi:DNA polymerase-3 subunit gamma/tau
MAMVQSRLPLLDQAVASALGSPRQVVLEAAGGTGLPGGSGGSPAPLPQLPRLDSTTPAPAATTTTPPAAAPAAPTTDDGPRPAAIDGVPPPTAPEPPAQPQPIAAPPSAAQPAPAAQALAGRPDLIDEKARRLAEFFNGEVVQLEGPLPDLSGGDGEAAA